MKEVMQKKSSSWSIDGFVIDRDDKKYQAVGSYGLENANGEILVSENLIVDSPFFQDAKSIFKIFGSNLDKNNVRFMTKEHFLCPLMGLIKIENSALCFEFWSEGHEHSGSGKIVRVSDSFYKNTGRLDRSNNKLFGWEFNLNQLS